MPPSKRILLCILDGWGVRRERAGNAIALAGTPSVDEFERDFPSTQLMTSGLAVGLPEGQMGNSEVGHTNIGAGRVVYQDLVRINLACERGELAAIEPLRAACESAAADGRALHLAGLCSDGGVHSSLLHLYALIDLAVQRGVRRLFIHAFTDGRDTAPDFGMGFIRQIEEVLRQKGLGRIATVCGRYFAMDRDQRWDRVEKAYRALVDGAGVKASSAGAAVLEAYQRGESDEFIAPTVVTEDGEPIGRIRDGDSFIFFNFRADRARELTRAIALPGFQSFPRDRLKLRQIVCLTEYEKDFGLPVAFASNQPHHILPEILSRHGLRQFRCAETEKYAHVTFFFNGGREEPFPGEDRAMVPSPRDVPTYDLKPAMSAPEVTAKLQAAIASEDYAFLLVNFANPDMVGHTGVLAAAIEAVKVVDHCLAEVYRTAMAHRTALVVTADHGNCELMIDPVTGGPHTQHTLNPVPFYLVDPDSRGRALRPGILADVAPTLLSLYGLEQPPEMSGNESPAPMNALRALGNAALDLLAPPSCPACNAGLFSGDDRAPPFCDACELAIAPRDPAGCVGCDREAGRGGLCWSCRRRLSPLSSVEATFEYEGPIAEAIQALKYQGRDDRLRPIARRWLAEWQLLSRPAGEGREGGYLIVPVPLHPRRLAARGFDQAWLLAREIAKALGAEARARAVRRIRATPPQVGLGRAAREANVRGAFQADETVAHREVLLVDDVLTTGSTLRACAEALMLAGARSVRAVVVARAQP